MIQYYDIKFTDAEDAVEPVSLQEAKDFMEVDYDDKDTLISSLITECRQQLQTELNRLLVKSDVLLTVKTSCASQPIDLAFYTSAEDFAISDLENDSLDFTEDEYTLLGDQVSINYKGSFALSWTETPRVPEDLKKAIKMLVAHRFKYRGDADNEMEMPPSVQRLIDKHMKVWL